MHTESFDFEFEMRYFLFFNFWYVVENWFVVIVECVWWKQWVVKSGLYMCGGKLGE